MVFRFPDLEDSYCFLPILQMHEPIRYVDFLERAITVMVST